MKILQVNTSDVAGGAEAVAWQLLQGYQRLGHDSWLAVGKKYSNHQDVVEFEHGRYSRLMMNAAKNIGPLIGRIEGVEGMRRQLRNLSYPLGLIDKTFGRENFNFPGTRRLFKSVFKKIDILHCHNLHGAFLPAGGYFDLRTLPWLSRQVPVVLTLHDAWLLAGHCVHSFDCDRWKTGCRQCGDLTIHPAIRRDSAAYNWRRKRDIYAKSGFYITAPSRWLMQKVEQSMLAPAILKNRVIHNGVDLSVFHPADKQIVRAETGIPIDAKVILFTAAGVRKNPWKDYITARTAATLVAEGMPKQSVIFVALGESGTAERVGKLKIQFVPFQVDPKDVARYYQAADVYIHAAKADTFPLTVLEALACGTPTVATAVCGIPEQIEDGVTGFLVTHNDPAAMALSIRRLLENSALRKAMCIKAAAVAQQRFGLERMVEDYLELYNEILNIQKC